MSCLHRSWRQDSCDGMFVILISNGGVFVTVAEETLIFLYSCLLGCGLAVIYDVFRILRLAFPGGKVMVFIEDGIFIVIATLATFIFCVNFCNGYFRVFVAIGEILGFIIYYFTVGILVFKAAKSIIRGVKAVLRFLYKIFVKPVVRFFKYICTKFKKLFKHISQKSPKGFFASKFHLKRHGKMMYNETNQQGTDRVGESEANCETQEEQG